MARRRKNRTHNKGAAADTEGDSSTPKSFIIKHGQVGSALSSLVRDMRKVMEPNTASRLRERTRNKLKDYLVLAPALKVSHILLFTLTEKSPYLRIVRTPAGPTATFRIERYSTMSDIRMSKRKPHGEGIEYRTAPLMVLSAFPVQPPHSLVAKLLQSLFPPLSPLTLKPSAARRVVLITYNAETNTIQLRHYLISVRSYGVSRRVRKVLRPGLDLGNVKDVADWLLGEEGYESASSAGSEGEEIEFPQSMKGEGSVKGEGSLQGDRKRAVKLEEVGPRMELKLVKITEGVPGKEGGVIFHEFVHKTPAERKAQDAEIKEREKIRKQRREEQERNVARKKETGEDADGDDAEDAAEAEEGDADIDGADEEENEEDWEEEIEEAEQSEDESESDGEEEGAKPPPPKRSKARR
ncbi:Brix-domain-containing protein [Calocera cornea HHB12733]|uniref:Brix-domain-containing protein n=1 Tax=Calocera cornea HHB12733 TaxID=1353952 RepID=A0A165GFN9_9BASI|nr:Brix-domain-containing protein [Calocera cornea HHB12733]